MYPVYTPTTPYAVPAEAANLEYSILSAILGGSGSPESGSSGSPATTHAPQPVGATPYVSPQVPSLSSATWPAEPMAQYGVGQTPAPAFAAATPPQYGESVVSHPLLSPDLIRLL